MSHALATPTLTLRPRGAKSESDCGQQLPQGSPTRFPHEARTIKASPPVVDRAPSSKAERVRDQHAAVLKLLGKAGKLGISPSLGQIAKALNVTNRVAQRSVDALVRAGYVVKRGPAHRRQLILGRAA